MALTTEGARIQEEPTTQDKDVQWRYQKAVSTFHYAVWAALLCRASAAPLAWCDGKEFGEMEATGNQRFGADYAVTYSDELRACHAVIKRVGAHNLAEMNEFQYKKHQGLHVFVRQGNGLALVWLVRDDGSNQGTVDLTQCGLTVTSGQVTWLHPWDGSQIGAVQTLTDVVPPPGGSVNPTAVPTELQSVVHSRPLAGTGHGTGPHEQEDILLLIRQ